MTDVYDYISTLVLYILIAYILLKKNFKRKEDIPSAEDVRKSFINKKKEDRIITLKYITERLMNGEKEVKIDQGFVDGYMLDVLRRKGYSVGEKGFFYIITV
jgi:hypothetical protein